MLQVLPGAKEEEIARFEKRIQEMPPISQLLTSQDPMDALLTAIYGDEPYKRLSEEKLSFSCDCSRERFEAALLTLGQAELTALKREDQQAEITCQFCGKHYLFTENDLEGLIEHG